MVDREVGDDHRVRALGQEPSRQRRTDAAAAARDYRYLALDFHRLTRT